MNTTLFHIMLTGDVPSKKNRYRIGHGRMYQDFEVVAWTESAYWQIYEQLRGPKIFETITEPLELVCDIFTTRERDLDNMLNSILDALQYAQVYKNDSQVRAIDARKFVDTHAPPGARITGRSLL